MTSHNAGFTRRTLLKGLAAASILPATGLRAGFAAEARAIAKRAVPSSGEMLPVMGFGTSRSLDNSDIAHAREMLTRFHALGGTVVDSSPMYGVAEKVIGTAGTEAKLLDKLFVATKVWTTGQDEGKQQMLESRIKLAKSPLDLIQVHNLVDLDTQLATLKQMKAEGDVRYIGVSHYRDSAHDDLTRLVETEALDFVQINYSLIERNAEKRLLPAAADKGVAIIVNRPFARGQLFAKTRGKPLPEWATDAGASSFGQLFLRFVVSHPSVTVAIPGTSKLKHLEDNMAAAGSPLMDAGQRKQVANWFADL